MDSTKITKSSQTTYSVWNPTKISRVRGSSAYTLWAHMCTPTMFSELTFTHKQLGSTWVVCVGWVKNGYVCLNFPSCGIKFLHVQRQKTSEQVFVHSQPPSHYIRTRAWLTTHDVHYARRMQNKIWCLRFLSACAAIQYAHATPLNNVIAILSYDTVGIPSIWCG